MPERYARLFCDAVRPRPLTLRGILRYTVLSSLGSVRRADHAPSLRCLFCHYVFDDQREQFERKIRYLMALGRFVDTATAIRMITGQEPIDGPCFHLSFDDGFKNIITNALPILVRYHVPSLFFVPTAFIGAPYARVADFCVRIAEYRNPIEMATWDDLIQASQYGLEVGSHTRTHSCFSQISSDHNRLVNELAGSKADIEQHLQRSCLSISWPYGQLKHADSSSLAMVKEVGYRVCFSSHRGSVMTGGCDSFLVPRHQFEGYWPLSHLNFFMGR